MMVAGWWVGRGKIRCTACVVAVAAFFYAGALAARFAFLLRDCADIHIVSGVSRL